MSYLRNSILATIIYYDVFDRPLTVIEVYKYLINPGRISKIPDGIGEIKLSNITEELDKLVSSRVVGSRNGFYFLAGREDLYELRMKRSQIAAKKWKKFLKLVRPLALAPYLRGLFGSGSMAIDNTEEESDFDVLIMARSSRLYTCRFFLWIISSLMLARRKKHQKVAPNMLCFNHYITDDSLRIIHESIFTAQTYVNLKPVMIEPQLVDEFYTANIWLNNYVYNFWPEKDFLRRSVVPNKLLKLIAGSIETCLDTTLGNQLEKILKYFQQKRIKGDPATYASGGRIVFTDSELEFHPASFERVFIDKYRAGLRRYGIISYVEEKDSGLNR